MPKQVGSQNTGVHVARFYNRHPAHSANFITVTCVFVSHKTGLFLVTLFSTSARCAREQLQPLPRKCYSCSLILTCCIALNMSAKNTLKHKVQKRTCFMQRTIARSIHVNYIHEIRVYKLYRMHISLTHKFAMKNYIAVCNN